MTICQLLLTRYMQYRTLFYLIDYHFCDAKVDGRVYALAKDLSGNFQ